jgi:hypothetical protein
VARDQKRPTGEPELDVSALYGLPLAEFTKARNDLAKRARAEGDPEEADSISRLKKPSLSAWALNMLPRLRESELGEVLRAGQRAELAQSGVLAGSADAVSLHEATEQLRSAARRVAGEAGEILVKGGHAAREETLLRIARALETCAVTAGGRARLEKGAFTDEPEAAGFDLFGQLSAAQAGEQPRVAEQKADRPHQLAGARERAEAQRAARQAVADARAELRGRRRERSEAERAARAAEQAAEVRRREAEAAWELVERKRERVDRARSAEVEAEQRLEEAESRLRPRKT